MNEFPYFYTLLIAFKNSLAYTSCTTPSALKTCKYIHTNKHRGTQRQSSCRPCLLPASSCSRPHISPPLSLPPSPQAVATEGGATFLTVDASVIESKWLGESEKNAKAVFTLARRLAPCVIYLDEVDSVLRYV